MGNEVRTIRGLLGGLTVKQAKGGKTYSEGDISLESGEKVRWRIWNTDISKVPAVQAGVVAELVGCDNEYNGVTTFILSCDKGIPLLKVLPGEKVDKYLETAPYDIKVMMTYIDKAVAELKDEGIKKVCKIVLERYAEKLAYWPFSHSSHAEKGGMLYHLVNSCGLARALTPEQYYRFNSGDAPEINRDTIIGSIISSCVGFLSSDVKVNSATGIIESRPDEELTYSLYGNAWNVQAVALIAEEAGVSSPAVDNMLHCLAYECGVVNQPLSAEAVFYRHLVRQELEVYSFATERRASKKMEPDSIVKVAR